MAEAVFRKRALRIEIAPPTILWVLLTIGAVWIVEKLWPVVSVLIVAFVIVGTVHPLVQWFERRGVHRGRALVLIFVGLGLVVAILILSLVPALVAQLEHLVANAPAARSKLVAFLTQYEWGRPLVKAINAVPLDALMTNAGKALLGYSTSIATVVGYAVTTLFVAIYLLADPAGANGFIYAMVPRRHHVKFARILIDLTAIIGGYMRGQLITSVAISAFTFCVLTLFGVKAALALAVLAGLADIIPFIGGYLASAPAILAVSGSGTGAMVTVGVLMVAYQEFENRFLVPRVYGRSLRLAPAVVTIALLVGGLLMGMLGALLALPFAAALQMIVRELRIELPGQSPPDKLVRERDENAELMYQQRTAGESVDKAAVVANEIAAKMKETEEGGKPPAAEPPPAARTVVSE